MRFHALVVAVPFVVAVAAGCGPKMSAISCSNAPTGVTYTNKVQSLLDNNCTECHASDKKLFQRRGAPSDINLDGYDNAKKNAEESAKALEEGSMPPEGGLSDEDRCIIRGWVNAGTPQ